MSFTAWSQTTSKDTAAVLNAEQLRTTSLIFAEHEFLKKDNHTLTEQITLLQQKVREDEKMMIQYRTALNELEHNMHKTTDTYIATNETLRNQLKQQQRKTRRRTIIGITIGVAAGIVIGAGF